MGLRGVALDVTDRKLAEELARATEKKDRAILSAIPDLMFLQTLDGVYLDYHATLANDLLVAPESFLGKNMREVLPSHLAEQFAEAFAKAQEGGEPQILEYSLDVGVGESSFEARMVRIGSTVLSIVRDITILKRSEQEALELGGRLITAQEDERGRLARELHDGVMQELALLSIELDMFGSDARNDPASAESKMKDLSSRVAGICGEIHRLSHELHPAILEQLGLVTAVRAICTEVEAVHDLSISFEVIDVPKLLPNELSLCLYRIVQESLQNVVKHSAAAHAEVRLWMDGETLSLKVSDDGCGFDPSTPAGQASLGLIGMRERIRLLNGDFSVTSAVGSGTLIKAVLPVRK
jgi:signal transduction histidine kinase